MGNRPPYHPAPLDRYMAVRASIEARLSNATANRKPSSSPAGCCGTDSRGLQMLGAPGGHPHGRLPSKRGTSNNASPLEQGGRMILPPTLSVAETADTNSDGAPDEFEAADATDDMLSGLSQSFTRAKAPHVRARSPLPFPSMATCSPTVSRRNEQKHEPQRRSFCSSSSDSDVESAPLGTCLVSSSPQPNRKPQQLTVAAFSGSQRTKQRETERDCLDARSREAPNACIDEADMFCPLSPNSALGSTTPTTVSWKGAQVAKSRHATPERGHMTQKVSEGREVSYGPACNHYPFLEGRALQMLLPLLFGPALGACMGVCVHWFMKISEGFETSYGKYLYPICATLKLQPLQTADGEGSRLDWVITAKVLAPCARNVVSLGYCFEYRHSGSLLSPGSSGKERAQDCSSKRSDAIPATAGFATRCRRGEGRNLAAVIRPPSRVGEFSSGCSRREVPTFSVAVASAGSKRRVWLHRDMCRFHGDETGQAVLTPLGPVCVGDLIEVPVVLSNGIGAAELSTVKWLPIHVVPRVPRVLAGPKALEAAALGLYEGCGLEMQYVEWFDGDQYRHMTTERLMRADCLEPELQHLSTSYSGIDVLVRRSLYSAVRVGSLGTTAQRAWGLECQVLPADVPIVFPLTRRGLLHDRSTSLQLRVGDILESYLTIGGANF